MTRDERQDQFTRLFEAEGGRGTLEATTAFGKTWVGLKVIKRLRRIHKERTVLIVVPKRYLKQQWEGFLKKHGQDKFTTVEVINTAVKRSYTVDLLILDEIHRYAADTFSEVFDKVTYRFILGLTATLKRLDRKHSVLKKYAPVIDQVTILEATTNEWIAPYLEFNLAVPLPEEEQVAMAKLEETYDKIMDVFQWDFGLMKKCCSSYKPEKITIPSKGTVYHHSACATVALDYGWTGNSPEVAWNALAARKSDIWGGPPHTYSPKMIYIRAVNGMRTLRKIKSIIYGHPLKVRTAIELCERLKMKAITFAELTKTADSITRGLPGSLSYHSKVKSTGKGKENEMKEIIRQLQDNEIRVINTAKSLDEGADFPDVQLGIRVAGSSSPIQHTQRRGRIVRKHEEKRAVMINLYLPNTKEHTWLTKAQGYETEIIWVESIDEIIESLTV